MHVILVKIIEMIIFLFKGIFLIFHDLVLFYDNFMTLIIKIMIH